MKKPKRREPWFSRLELVTLIVLLVLVLVVLLWDVDTWLCVIGCY